MARPINEELRKARKEEILNAAARVFRIKGFHLARTEDICSEAGISAGTLFRYFKTKQEIIQAIVAIESAQSSEEVKQIASKEGMHQLANITADGLKKMLTPRGFSLGSESWLELSRSAEGRVQLAKFEQEIRQTLASELALGQKAGWVRKELNCEGAAKILLSIIVGLQFDLDMGLEIDFPSTAHALADLVSAYIIA